MVEPKRCHACGRVVDGEEMFLLPHEGMRCYNCALEFLTYYAAHAEALLRMVVESKRPRPKRKEVNTE